MFDVFQTQITTVITITILKKNLFLVLIGLVAFVNTTKAQLGYNYAQYNFGVGLGYLKASTDVPLQSSYPAVNFNFGYNISPYFTLSADFQIGQLSGGYANYVSKSLATTTTADQGYAVLSQLSYNLYGTTYDPYYRSYTNNFQALTLHLDLQAGEVLDLNPDKIVQRALRNIYVGVGIGLIYNKITNNNRISPDSSYYYGGEDQSQNLMIPLRVGYQFKLYNNYDEPFVFINVGYEYNYVLGYGLDGYADPLLVTKKTEKYSGFNIGIRYNFGSVTSYRKQFHY